MKEDRLISVHQAALPPTLTHAHTHTHTRTHARTHSLTHTLTRTHARTHARTHTHTHTHTWRCGKIYNVFISNIYFKLYLLYRTAYYSEYHYMCSREHTNKGQYCTDTTAKTKGEPNIYCLLLSTCIFGIKQAVKCILTPYWFKITWDDTASKMHLTQARYVTCTSD